MSILSRIGNALGVPELWRRVRALEDGRTSPEDRRYEIARAFCAITQGARTDLINYGLSEDQGATFERTLRRVVSEQATSTAAEVTAELLGREALVDELVARILRKQLPGGA